MAELKGTWHGTVTMKGNYLIDQENDVPIACFDDYSVDVDLSISGSSYSYSMHVDAPYLPSKLAYPSGSGEISNLNYNSGSADNNNCYVYSNPQDKYLGSGWNNMLFHCYNFDNNSFDIEFYLLDRENLLDIMAGGLYGSAFGKLYRTESDSSANSESSSSGSDLDEKYTITSIKAVRITFAQSISGDTKYSDYQTVNMYKWLLNVDNKVVLSTSSTDKTKWMVASKNSYKELGGYDVSRYSYCCKHFTSGTIGGYYYFFN